MSEHPIPDAPQRRTPGDEFVQALARGLEVITSFDAEHATMTLSDVSKRTGLSRATCRRLLLTLVELGYVRTDGKAFTLTPQVLKLGTAYLAGLGLPQVAHPHLEKLSAALGESTSCAVLDGTDIVYVARCSTRRLMTVGITVGTRFPAHATSMGRVLLAAERDLALPETLPALTAHTVTDPDVLRAELVQVREQGYAVVTQELELGLRSIAVPVRTSDGKIPAAINVSLPMNSPLDPLDRLDQVQATARAIAEDLDHLH
ncbi:IclR family transcriptional regulator domain-containing protein [Nocardioides yefusunii]|uniref:IclR family transcriptional regulator C-terminal domain-containing protein n=1 Tax=Nocardioides yefusunii TaxID=2500546 RepID=A0ABW1QSB5_9ACTN|nr:IclR family transcriptional regulator C-terminal domain-containing protein [Nocardioides yefusunii]